MIPLIFRFYALQQRHRRSRPELGFVTQ